MAWCEVSTQPPARIAMTETRKAHCQPRGTRSIRARISPVLIQTLIAASLAFAMPSSAGAQVRGERRGSPVPPPVVSQTVNAQRGGKVTVPLAIHGVRGEMLEFLIRTPPQNGKLSPVKSTAMNSASVTYTSSAKSVAAEDRFTYAVRGSEGVSAPGLITIRFAGGAPAAVASTVAAPRLRAPAELEFPPVYPGQRSTVELEIANDGGGVLEGEVTVPEPWSVEGIRFFKITAGNSATFRLLFSPTQPGVKIGEAIITGSVRRIIELRASAEQRMEVSPALLKLTAQSGNHTRMGVLKIMNRADEDASVTLEAGARLLTDRTIKIPARGTSSVPVFADAALGGAFDDTVKLSSREWSATVNVHAVAVGAILRYSAEEVSIAGSTGDATASGTAILENSGGEALTVRLDLERPFDVETRVVTVPARGSVEIPVLVRAAVAGTFRSSMKAVGEGGSASVLVKAEIQEASVTPAPARTASAVIESNPEASAVAAAPTENETPLISENVREIPNAMGRFARATGSDSAVMDWPANLGDVEKLRIEERVLSFSADGELQIAWVPRPTAKIVPAGERMRAELRGLKPTMPYTVRVVSGKDSDPSVLFTADFWTAAQKPILTGAVRTPLLIVALCGLLFAIWRSHRKSQRPGK